MLKYHIFWSINVKEDYTMTEEKIAIEKNIIDHYANIKDLIDSAVSALNKSGEYSEDEFTEFFEMTEQIQEQLEEVRDLLGELS
jgi:hypothetical protein